eukprot:COSAG01_NODE_10061_length_2259_cov_5.583333_1_plen_591_part_10
MPLIVALLVSTASAAMKTSISCTNDDTGKSVDCTPQITSARLRAVQDNWGQKLKLGYTLMHDDEDIPHEVCFGCTIDDNGVALPEDKDKIEEGGTCGGHPNGCGVLKGEELAWGKKVTVAFRLKDGSFWSPWSKPEVYYYVDPALNDGKLHKLRAIKIGEEPGPEGAAEPAETAAEPVEEPVDEEAVPPEDDEEAPEEEGGEDVEDEGDEGAEDVEDVDVDAEDVEGEDEDEDDGDEETEKIKEKVRKFYSKHAPTKLANVKKKLQEYKGREAELLAELKAKHQARLKKMAKKGDIPFDNQWLPKMEQARLRSAADSWGQKLKLKYELKTPDWPHQACFGCKIDDKGVADRKSFNYAECGTCGGHPHGCCTGKNPQWGSTVGVAFRFKDMKSGRWTTWSQPLKTYFINPDLNDGGYHEIKAIEDGGNTTTAAEREEEDDEDEAEDGDEEVVLLEEDEEAAAKVREFYQTHLPDKLDKLDAVLLKYRGQEVDLLVALQDKYLNTDDADEEGGDAPSEDEEGVEPDEESGYGETAPPENEEEEAESEDSDEGDEEDEDVEGEDEDEDDGDEETEKIKEKVRKFYSKHAPTKLA